MFGSSQKFSSPGHGDPDSISFTSPGRDGIDSDKSRSNRHSSKTSNFVQLQQQNIDMDGPQLQRIQVGESREQQQLVTLAVDNAGIRNGFVDDYAQPGYDEPPPQYTEGDFQVHREPSVLEHEEEAPPAPTTVAQCLRPKRYPEWQDDLMSDMLLSWPKESWAQRDETSIRSVSSVRYHLEDGPPPDGLALLPGDNVFRPHSQAQWTQNWGWCLYWRLSSDVLSDHSSDWVISVAILSKSRPCEQAPGSIVFSNSHLSPGQGLVGQIGGDLAPRFSKFRKWAFTSLEVAPQADRDWMAEVVLIHVDPSQFENFDWRGQLTAKKTVFFKVDQKVTLSEYKNVVVMDRGGWYGNDLTGQEAESWADDMPERLAEFAGSIMSLG